MKQNKIIIGPRKGFKLTKQNLIRLEKLERLKSLSILQEETGSCKYCGLSFPVKHLKQHYLNHSKELSAPPQTEVGSVQVAGEEKTVERPGGVLLQENSISSSDSSREAREDQSGLSRPELDIDNEDNVSQYEQRDLLISSEQPKVDTDISTSDKVKEVAQLNSTESEKVKSNIRLRQIGAVFSRLNKPTYRCGPVQLSVQW